MENCRGLIDNKYSYSVSQRNMWEMLGVTRLRFLKLQLMTKMCGKYFNLNGYDQMFYICCKTSFSRTTSIIEQVTIYNQHQTINNVDGNVDICGWLCDCDYIVEKLCICDDNATSFGRIYRFIHGMPLHGVENIRKEIFKISE